MTSKWLLAACAAVAVAVADVGRPIVFAKEDQQVITDRRYSPACPKAAQSQIFVSASGSDTAGDGSYGNPYASLTRAQSAVRSLLPTQNGDIFVYFRAGLYNLTNTVSFGLQDGGNNGFTIRYSAWPADNAPVVLHGAAVVSPGSWQQTSVNGVTVYSAPAPYNSRQLFFSGNRAQRAGFDVSSFNWSITSTGYIVPAAQGGSTLLSWWAQQPAGSDGSKDAFELLYTGSGSTWTEPRCRTASVESLPDGSANITVTEPCFSHGRNRGAAWQNMKTPLSVENVLAAVVQEGTFFHSISTGVVYYYPWDGQNMRTDVAYIPVLEQLVNISGTFDYKQGTGQRISGLAFEGLTFAYSTWLLPSTPVGFVDNQGPDIYVENGSMLIPGAVQVHGGAHIDFIGCTLYGLGSSGLVVDNGSQNVTFINGTVNNVAGAGILLGNVDDGSQWNPDLRNGGHWIHNSYFLNTPSEYHGTSAIFGGYLRDTVFSHNFLYRPPNGGICSGWGWGNVNNSYSGNLQILNNRIEGSNWLLEDCGSIYVNGHNTGSLAQGNYAFQQVKLYGALYPDEGSTNWVWLDNVAEDVPEPIHIWTLSIQNITMTRNYYGPSDYLTLNGTDMHVYNNTWVGPGQAWPAAAEVIKANAGLLPWP